MKIVAFIMVIAVLVILSIFLIIYERKNTDVRKLMFIAVMTAMSVAGRFLFAAIPGFKPVTAIVVIAGMYLGCEAGFFCGSLTALISNCYFGQGMWTPYQMLLWGMIGIVAGLMANPLKRSKVALCIYGAVAGVVFSLVMDLYSTLWVSGGFSWQIYTGLIATALPYTILYAVSNIFFLLVLAGLMGRKIEHANRVLPF